MRTLVVPKELLLHKAKVERLPVRVIRRQRLGENGDVLAVELWYGLLIDVEWCAEEVSRSEEGTLLEKLRAEKVEHSVEDTAEMRRAPIDGGSSAP